MQQLSSWGEHVDDGGRAHDRMDQDPILIQVCMNRHA